MNELAQYNLRDLKKEFLSRIGLSEYTTAQLLAEIGRREEAEKDREAAHIVPAHRKFLRFCAEHFDLTISELTGPKRYQGLVNARHISMCVAAKVFRLGGHQAARLLNRKNHTSHYHASRVLKNYPALREEAKILETKWINRNRNN